MNILLDECVDRRLTRHIAGHDVRTVPELGWTGVKNGELLARAAAKFDAFVTTDRNLAFQQNVATLAVAVIILRAKSNRLADLLPLIPTLLTGLASAPKGIVTTIDA